MDCDPIPTVPPGEPAKPTNLGGGSGSAPGACVDYEVVCFDSGPSPLLLRTVTDCDPLSVTFGALLSVDYRDPNAPATVVVPTGSAVVCPSTAGLCCQAEVLCGPAPFPQFVRVYQVDASGAIVNVNDFDLDGNPIPTVAGAFDCVTDADALEHVLLDAAGVPFIRRILMQGSTVLGVADFTLDGITPFAAVTPVGPPDGEYLILCDQQGNGTAVTFMRRLRSDGQILADTLLDSLTPYVVTGTVVADCAERQVIQVPLCEYDSANQVYLAEFLRTWVYDGNGIVLVGPVDTLLDGTTPHVVGLGSITRSCENVVDCDNDPCVSGLDRTVAIDPSMPLPSVFNGTGFTSFQFDNPPTAVGSTAYKVDIFDGGAAGQGLDLVGTAGFETGRLVEWLMSGPGGDRPPADEIFVLRDVIGGPGGGAVGLSPATAGFQAAGVPLVIPGWAVRPRGIGWFHFSNNPSFLNLTVDLELLNPQRCDLATIDLDPVGDPGVSIAAYLAAWSFVIDEHMTPLAPVVDPNLAFEVGVTGSGDVEIFTFNSGNPVQSDSVVLCQTIVDNIVCFDGEDEPVQSITALNPHGQIVFGPLFRRLDNGAFVTPTGNPVDCTANALQRYEAQCGSCSAALTQNIAALPGSGASFQMGQTNRNPGPIIMRIVEGGASPLTNLAAELCNWYLTPGNERTVFILPSVNGGVWASRPVVIPHWAVSGFDCSVPGTVALQILPDVAGTHPGGCDITADPTLANQWASFVAAQTQQFNTSGHPLISFTLASPSYQVWSLATSGGPALRVSSCDPVTDPMPMCDMLGDGTVIQFRRYIEIDSDGLVSIVDRLYDGTPYAPMGMVNSADSLCAHADPFACVVGTTCVGVPDPEQVHGPAVAADRYQITTVVGPGNWLGVDLQSTSNPTLVDDMMACAGAGDLVVAFPFSSLFGSGGLVLSVSGMTNVVQNGPGDWSFDLDTAAILADLQANCPGMLATPVTANGFTLTVADWLNQQISAFAIAGFPFRFQATTGVVCVRQELLDVTRSPLVTRPCQEIEVPVCRYGLIAEEIPANAPGSPFTAEVLSFDSWGDTAFTLAFDLTAEPGWLASLQAWIAAGIEPGDIVSIPGTWGTNPAGPTPSVTTGRRFILGEWMFTTPPVVTGNVVTFTLDTAASPPCRQGIFEIGGSLQASDFERGAREWQDCLADEYLNNNAPAPFTAGPFEIQADQGPLVVGRANDRIGAAPVALVGAVQVDQTDTLAVPGVAEVPTSGGALAINLDTLGASSVAVHVISAGVTLGPNLGSVPPVALPVGVYEFAITGQRGKVYRGAAGDGDGFWLDCSTGGQCIVTYTRTV